MLSQLTTLFNNRPKEHPGKFSTDLPSRPPPNYGDPTKLPDRKPLPHDHKVSGATLRHLFFKSKPAQEHVIMESDTTPLVSPSEDQLASLAQHEECLRKGREGKKSVKDLRDRVGWVCAAQYQ
jgi:hypothetical protein